MTGNFWVQCLFKGDDSDEGCEKEVVEILSMTIMDKGTKGKTGKPRCMHSTS